MAKNPGKQFEEDFKKSVNADHFIYRLKDAGSNIGGQNDNLRFQIKNMCDYIMFNTFERTLWLLELKSTQGTSIPFTMIDSVKKNPEKRYKNLRDMVKEGDKDFVNSVVIFNMRKWNETYSVKASHVLDFVLNGDRKSIPIDWIRKYGIVIPQRQLVKNWRYDIVPMAGFGISKRIEVK